MISVKVQLASPEKSVRTINFALPPDVRRGCAAPSAIFRIMGCAFLFTTTARQSPASHRAAEPLQVRQKHFSGKAYRQGG